MRSKQIYCLFNEFLPVLISRDPVLHQSLISVIRDLNVVKLIVSRCSPDVLKSKEGDEFAFVYLNVREITTTLLAIPRTAWMRRPLVIKDEPGALHTSVVFALVHSIFALVRSVGMVLLAMGLLVREPATICPGYWPPLFEGNHL